MDRYTVTFYEMLPMGPHILANFHNITYSHARGLVAGTSGNVVARMSPFTSYRCSLETR